MFASRGGKFHKYLCTNRCSYKYLHKLIRRFSRSGSCGCVLPGISGSLRVRQEMECKWPLCLGTKVVIGRSGATRQYCGFDLWLFQARWPMSGGPRSPVHSSGDKILLPLPKPTRNFTFRMMNVKTIQPEFVKLELSPKKVEANWALFPNSFLSLNPWRIHSTVQPVFKWQRKKSVQGHLRRGTTPAADTHHCPGLDSDDEKKIHP